MGVWECTELFQKNDVTSLILPRCCFEIFCCNVCLWSESQIPQAPGRFATSQCYRCTLFESPAVQSFVLSMPLADNGDKSLCYIAVNRFSSPCHLEIENKG